MKKNLGIGFALAIFVFLTSLCTKEEISLKPFSFSPEKPVPGDTVTVTYTPVKDAFKSTSQLYMLAYSVKTGWPKVIEVSLEKKKGGWAGTFTPEEESRCIIVKFKAGEEIDNNDNQGFLIPLFTKEGGLMPGGKAGMAEAYSYWGDTVIGINQDNEKALQNFDLEFNANPEMKKEYLASYLMTLNSTKPEGWENTALSVLDEVVASGKIEDETFRTLIRWYKTLKKEEKAAELLLKAREQYPKGLFVQSERWKEFYEEKDFQKKLALFEAFKSDFPESNMLSNFYYLIVQGYLNDDQIDGLKKFFAKNLEISDGYVFRMGASQLLKEEKELDFAVQLIKKGVEIYRKQLREPGDDKPSYLTQEDWETQIKKYSLSSLFDIHGQLLIKKDQISEALQVFEEAVTLSEGSNPKINESYGEALIEEKMFQKAHDKLSEFIREGNGSQKLEELLTTAYEHVNSNGEDFDGYLAELNQAANDKVRAELEKKILDEAAPDFTLEDLEANQISLSALKGKILVMDFWATWCGPCVSSFPGMKRAVEKFKGDPSVEFLFVNTWQKEEDKKKNAQDFITKNNYPFHVLLDEEDKVVEKFKVTGIPTKFVVDKNGRIRFKSVGYGGNNEKMIRELSLMIEMVK